MLLSPDGFGSQSMYRVILSTAAALMAFGIVAAPAMADDRDTCRIAIGDDAIAACNRLIQRNPNDAVAYANGGIAYENKGDHDRAISHYDQAVKLDPKYVHAYVLRGIAYANKSDHDRAIADY